MELRKIQYFLRIVDEGSLSKAAQSLYLSQPTLSRFLEKLEEELGVALFTRSKNNTLVLTPAGQTYLRTARKIDKLWHQLDGELAADRKIDRNLTFGVCGDYLLPAAAQCAEKVRECYPELTVSYFSDSSPELQRMVAEGQLRIALCAYDHKDARLSYVQSSKVEMNLVVAKDHPLASCSYKLSGQEEKRISLSELGEDAAFAMMRGDTVLRSTAERYLNRQKYVPDIRQTYLRHGSIGQVVGKSRLIGFCPANNLSEQLAYIALDPPFYYTQGVCWLQKTALRPAEKLLVNLLKKASPTRWME